MGYTMTLRRRYFVADEDGPCAGNVTKRFARRYAEGRASLGRACVVGYFKKNGTVVITDEFSSAHESTHGGPDAR